VAVTSEGRVALYLQDKHPIREGMRYVQLAEENGFEAVWQAESRLVREATVPMAAFAAVTERIAIGSGVVNNWTRNVGLLAATFSTLDDLAPGRVKLGIGAWWDPLAAKVGIHRRKTLTAMRETVETVRRLLAMERVTYHGEFVHLDDVEIDIVHGDRSPKHVPIYIGATAMKMMELAGEIGDGVVLNYLVGAGYNREAMEHLAIGAERAGQVRIAPNSSSSSGATPLAFMMCGCWPRYCVTSSRARSSASERSASSEQTTSWGRSTSSTVRPARSAPIARCSIASRL
jgi:5,10-methylenetetrahydromethanopterin reductase